MFPPFKGSVLIILCRADTLAFFETCCKQRFLGNLGDFVGRPSSRQSSVTSPSPSSSLTYASSSCSESFPFPTEAIESVDSETTKMFKDLQYLSAQVAASDKGIATIDASELADAICSAENHIDSLIHVRIERVDTKEHNPEFASLVLEHGNDIPVMSCALSAWIYIYLFIRRIPIRSSVFDWMVDRFQQDFERTEAAVRDLYPPDQLWWMLSVVGAASLGRRNRWWILRKMDRGLKLNRWSDAKEVLEKVAWVESTGELYGKIVWEEMNGYC